MTGRAVRLVIFLVLTPWLSPAQSNCPGHPSHATEDSGLVKVRRLDINSDKSDFSPFIRNNKLLFVSGRRSLAVLEYKDASGSSEMTDLYLANMKDSVTSTSCQHLPAAINTKYHQGPLTLSLTGDTLYFTTNDRRHEQAKIFTSVKKQGKWSEPQILPFCTDNFTYCHPAFSSGYDTLWFSSDRQGGYGMTDLYFSVVTRDGWSEPVNAGPQVNSPSNELFPFIPRKGTLFFASNREGGYGGMDIYRRPGDLEPERCPFPINSDADDFGIWTDSTLLKGYLSSNRVPRYKDDIFYFSNALPDFTGARSYLRRKKFCYTFFDTITQTLNDTITFEFNWDFNDGSKAQGPVVKHCYAQPGEYAVNLEIIQRVKGEVFTNSTVYDLSIPTPPAFEISCADSIPAGNCVEATYLLEGLKDLRVKSAFWLFGDGYHNTGGSVAHRYREPGEYMLTLFALAEDKKKGVLNKIKAEKKIIVY